MENSELLNNLKEKFELINEHAEDEFARALAGEALDMFSEAYLLESCFDKFASIADTQCGAFADTLARDGLNLIARKHRESRIACTVQVRDSVRGILAYVRAGALQKQWGNKLLGQKIVTLPLGTWPGGLVEITQIAPDPECAEEIAFQVQSEEHGETGVFADEQVGLPSEYWEGIICK